MKRAISPVSSCAAVSIRINSERRRTLDRGDQPGEWLEMVSPCTIQKLVHVRRVLGGTAGRRGNRRGGLYLLSAGRNRFDLDWVGSLGVEEERRSLRRQSDDHHFGSLLVLAVTAGAFLLVAWIATKALFVFL